MGQSRWWHMQLELNQIDLCVVNMRIRVLNFLFIDIKFKTWYPWDPNIKWAVIFTTFEFLGPTYGPETSLSNPNVLHSYTAIEPGNSILDEASGPGSPTKYQPICKTLCTSRWVHWGLWIFWSRARSKSINERPVPFSGV